MTTKTKVILGGIGLFLLLGAIGNATSPKTSVEGIQTTIPTIVTTPTVTPTPTIEQAQGDPEVLYEQGEQAKQDAIDNGQYVPVGQNDSQSGLSNNNYYTNSDGNQVHSPANSTNGSVPAGATAQCRDGTYSFSQHHQGTCSGHGGVSTWYQ